MLAVNRKNVELECQSSILIVKSDWTMIPSATSSRSTPFMSLVLPMIKIGTDKSYQRLRSFIIKIVQTYRIRSIRLRPSCTRQWNQMIRGKIPCPGWPFSRGVTGATAWDSGHRIKTKANRRFYQISKRSKQLLQRWTTWLQRATTWKVNIFIAFSIFWMGSS